MLRDELLELGVLGGAPVASRAQLPLPTTGAVATAAASILQALCMAMLHLLWNDGRLLFVVERRKSSRRWSTAGETSHLMNHLGSRLEGRGLCL